MTALDVDEFTPGRIFASSPFAGYRGSDYRRTWQRVSVTTGFGHINFIVDPGTPHRVWAVANTVVGGGGVMSMFTDGGEAWSAVSFPPHPGGSDVVTLATLLPLQPPALFAAAVTLGARSIVDRWALSRSRATVRADRAPQPQFENEPETGGWLGRRDSNPDNHVQSVVSYR